MTKKGKVGKSKKSKQISSEYDKIEGRKSENRREIKLENMREKKSENRREIKYCRNRRMTLKQ